MDRVVKLAHILAWFLVVCLQMPAQSTIRPFSVGCQTATGSASAAENLNKLKGLDAATPGLSEAIAKCESRITLLRQQEDDLWKEAIQSRDLFNCANAKRLFQQLYAKDTYYRLDASQQIIKLGDCGQAGSSLSQENENLRRAEGAYRTGDFIQARYLARKVASISGPLQKAAQDLLNTLDLREQNNKRRQDARVAILRKQSDTACSLLREIEASDPVYPGLEELRTGAGGCPPLVDPIQASAPRTPPAADGKPDVRFAERRKLEQLYASGDFWSAYQALKSAKLPVRPNPDVQKLVQKIEAAHQEEQNALSAGERLFSNDKDYKQVQTGLRQFLVKKRSPYATAFALFYIGAAVTHEYYLSHQENPNLRLEAVKLFAESAGASSAFIPAWTRLSPRVRALYSEATNGQPKVAAQ